MKPYFSYLMLSGAALTLLAAQPLQAATEEQEISKKSSQLPANFSEVLEENTSPVFPLNQENLKGDYQKDWQYLTFKPEQTFSASSPSEKLPLKFPAATSQKLGKSPEIPSLLAQTPSTTPGVLVPQPEIIIKSNGTPGAPDINMMPPSVPVAPVLPRAVAPPVGDIAVSNIDTTATTIKLGTPAIVPRLVLRQAPAREVLAVLARYAGMNVVFLDQQAQAQGQQANGNTPLPPAEVQVSLDLANEPVEEVFNSVLMISGLRANRRGKTIFVGPDLPNAARNLISRTLRLNQAKAVNAATFLATQGAEYQRLVIKYKEIIDPITQRIVRREEQAAELEPLSGVKREGSTSPFLLSGLSVTADDRLNSVTMIGEPQQVEVATSMLTQLDARRRQVVINVKIIDVNLINTQDFSSSFSFGFNKGFFLQDAGAALLNFGQVNPPGIIPTQTGTFLPTVVPFTSTIPGILPGEGQLFLDNQPNAPFGQISRFDNFPYARPGFGTFNNPFQPGVSRVAGNQIEYTLPALYQYPQRFLLTLQAQITSGNAKILTDPTLVVQEGQEASVKLVQKVIESVKIDVDTGGTGGSVRTITPILADAGLTLTVNIDKIDDNGFVNLSVSPTVAAPGAEQQFNSGEGAVNTLTLLNKRELSSGLIRLRDGQTLILSGVISEAERTTVTKVPILGDIPILGALFRSTQNTSDRNEVIILLTPQIIDDNPNAALGYNYTPGRDASQILQKQGFPVPAQPLGRP
jgi:type IV pilus assembly protein PilQ